jgi:Tfp pilus assembly protein PilE
MGQQQLLLTILVTIIIGIAVIVAINTMQGAFAESNRSALRQDMLMVLNDAQIYYEKPAVLGGGGNSFDGISIQQIQSVDPENENGSYKVSGSGDSVTVEGTGNNEAITLSATATITSDGIDVSWSEPSE